MNTTFMEAAAHELGRFRIGRHSIPGQGRLVDGLGKLAGWIAGNQTFAVPWPGVRLEVDLADRIQRQMWAGTYEPHVRACLELILQPGDVYFDVGGHIGYHAVAAAHVVGDGGRVFAFEADPKMYERLARNLAQFSWTQATHAAVWSHGGELTFARSPVAQESGWGTLSEVRDFSEGEHIHVRALSLDEWCREAQITRWNMMKLDAEGSEFAVLQGAQHALQKFHPVLLMEMNGVLLNEAGISPAQVADFLRSRNYRIFSLSSDRVEPWDLARHGEFCDALCLPGTVADAVLKKLLTGGIKRVS